jgi:hypothetical protein
MLHINKFLNKKSIILLFLISLLPGKSLLAQDYRYGVYATPVISWFKTDIKEVKNQGAKAGFIFGISVERSLTDNWHFNSGLAFTSSSAMLKNINPSLFNDRVVAAGQPVIYRLQYLSVPVGIKIKTNEIGYLTYFAGFGLDPKVVISGRADIPSINIKGQSAMKEIKRFNAGYHLEGGIDYLTNSDISLILGLGYESNIFDITKDISGQPADRTTQKFLKFIFGINF